MKKAKEEKMTALSIQTEEAKASEKKQYEDFEIKEAAEVLLKYADICEEPELKKLANQELQKRKEKINKVTSIADIRKAANGEADEEENYEEEEP
jgi:hypothetical protein